MLRKIQWNVVWLRIKELAVDARLIPDRSGVQFVIDIGLERPVPERGYY